jgi:uncharacterized protein (TIGR02271 family)
MPDSPEVFHLSILKEELDIQKPTKITGVVRLDKTVRTTDAVIEEDLVRESFSVERVPINRYVTEAASTRQEGDTMVIPVMEEIVVVTKQLVLREEIRITRHREQSQQTEILSLRSEEVEVKRLEPTEPTARSLLQELI